MAGERFIVVIRTVAQTAPDALVHYAIAYQAGDDWRHANWARWFEHATSLDKAAADAVLAIARENWLSATWGGFYQEPFADQVKHLKTFGERVE